MVSAQADSPTEHIVTRVSAEIWARSFSTDAAPGESKLHVAQRVVPGDVLIYTVEIRNTDEYSVESAVVVQPIPKHTMYVADSAVGPGVEVDYSVDGGRSFDKPENLKSPNATGTKAPARMQRAAPADYTHIRWRLHNRLKPKSIAFVRFRAQVQ